MFALTLPASGLFLVFVCIFFPTVDVVLARWALHTSLSNLNGSQLKVGHFFPPFALLEWIPSPLI